MMTGLNLVAAGIGITIVPASMRGAHASAIAYRDLHRGAQLEAPLTLLYREDRREGALASFIALVAELADRPVVRARPSRRRPRAAAQSPA